jgi:hypothetical protein
VSRADKKNNEHKKGNAREGGGGRGNKQNQNSMEVQRKD